MNFKSVSQLDQNGKFIGATTADESPLEPGVFLIPAGAVDVDPPVVPSGYYAVWNGEGFDFVLTAVEETIEQTPTAEQILATKKAERQAIVDAITVTTSTGKTFDGNEDAIRRMTSAIMAAGILGVTSTDNWVLANNTPTTVTLDELKEALALSMQAMGAVWATPYKS